MLVTIKRIKGGSIHFAKTVEAAGNVTEWVENLSAAGAFSEEVANACAKFYAGRLNAGRVIVLDDAGKTLVAVEGTVAVKTDGKGLAPPAVSDVAIERDEFQKQAELLGEEVAALRAKLAEAEAIIASTK